MSSQTSVPKSICLLRLSAIGDVCHAVAMVQHLQQCWPQTNITWVIGKVEATLLVGLANVELIIFDKKAGLKGYRDLWKKLQDQRFDILLHMQVALRASLASLCIRAKVKIGFDRKRAKEGQWLFTDQRVAAQTNPHVFDGFMGFVQALGLPKGSPSWQMPLTAQIQSWASEQLLTERPIAVICPAASKIERNWHSEGYANIADYLTARGFQVVLCGGFATMEILLATEIISHANSQIINLVGKTTLKQLLAVLKKAHLLIAPDTGPAHMAVTVGTPVIGLYAHSDPRRTGPYLYQQYVVSCYHHVIEQQHNKPLAKLPWGIRAKGKDLMTAITKEQVKAKIQQLITDHYPELP